MDKKASTETRRGPAEKSERSRSEARKQGERKAGHQEESSK